MGGCCGQATPDNEIWTWTSRDGLETKDVIGHQNALVEQTKRGSGTIKKKK
jgi:hypothetical protein